VIKHFFFAPNPISSAASRFITWARRGPCVQTVCSAPKNISRAAKLLFGDKVVVLSEHTRRRFIEAGVSAKRLRLIFPGVAVGTEPTAAEITATRKRYGWHDRPVVLFAGDYDFSQAAKTMLEAAFRVCADHPQVLFIFAGRIKNQRSADQEQRMKALVARDGLTERIHFYNLMEDFMAVLAAVDLCTLPAESVYAKVDLPLTLLEAMARKTPVIVGDAGPLPELLQYSDEHGRIGGETVAPCDPQGLAALLSRLLQEPKRLQGMGEAARSVVQKHFSATAMALAHQSLYREILEGSK
jgi:phosphatidylinositol alpha-1,6-mannosyltransferase